MEDLLSLQEQVKVALQEFKEAKLNQIGLKFFDNMEKKLPLELLEKRGIIEGNVIGCLYSNSDLYIDSKDHLSEKDFITEEGRLFYRLGYEIVKSGIKSLDTIALRTYLSSKNALCSIFEQYGGINTINDLKCTGYENFEYYLDNLLKYNALNRLHMKGFNIIQNLNKFKKMTSSQIYDWHDYMVSDTFLKTSNTVKPISLTKGNKKYLEKANAGLEKGIDIDEPILNYHLAGIHRGNILLHTAHSGIGKTSSIIPLYILPIAKRGEKVVLLINEQSEDAWRNMLIISAISNGYVKDKNGKTLKWVRRNVLNMGNFKDSENGKILKQGAEWLDNYCKGEIILYPLEDYSVGTLKKIIKKMMRLDEETTFILDTWKPDDESSNNAHAIFTEGSKELYKVIKPKEMGGLNVRFIATAQLAGATITQRYLNMGSLAKAKAILEVIGQYIAMRRLWQDEYDEKSKYYCKPFKYDKLTGQEIEVKLDPKKTYTVIFISKNRYGKADIQLLAESNLDFNKWKIICYARIKQDY